MEYMILDILTAEDGTKWGKAKITMEILVAIVLMAGLIFFSYQDITREQPPPQWYSHRIEVGESIGRFTYASFLNNTITFGEEHSSSLFGPPSFSYTQYQYTKGMNIQGPGLFNITVWASGRMDYWTTYQY